MKWTHKNTWKDGPGHTITLDRSVYRDGVRVGRIYVERYGPQAGVYQWFGSWAGYDNTGKCGTLDEALEAIRSRAPGDDRIYDKKRSIGSNEPKGTV